tara:strand:- start:757 stop:1065 length:309 start_codon:yes stop_codon:yes gene_type:complete
MKPINHYISTQLDLDYAANLAKQVSPGSVLWYMALVNLVVVFISFGPIAAQHVPENPITMFAVYWLGAACKWFWGPLLAWVVGSAVWTVLEEICGSFVAWRA